MLDFLIKNATIVDGAGNAAFVGCVGTKGDTIYSVGVIELEAKRVIDGSGLLLMPGFIDMHCHPEGLVFSGQRYKLRAMQGITTEVGGNCGISVAPCNENIALLKNYCSATFSGFTLPWDWSSFHSHLLRAQEIGLRINYATLVGHGALRIAVMGMDNREPTPSEMDSMASLLRQSLKEGALGLSLGLIYPPGVFAGTRELTTLAKIVREEGRLLAVHMRNESNGVVEALSEMIGIAEETGVKMHISHHKIGGFRNKGLSDITLSMIDDCRKKGIDIAFDIYPYNSGCTQLSAILPPWVHEGGIDKLLKRLSDTATFAKIIEQIQNNDDSFDSLANAATWGNIIISYARDKSLIGKSIEQIARDRNQEELQCALSLILEQQNDIIMILFTMNEYDVERIMTHHLSIFASDGVPSLSDSTHPRYLGTFLRVLSQYCKVQGLFTLEEAVSKMTGRVAARLGLEDRGTIEAGKKADLLLLDYDNLEDVTTYEQPNKTNPAVKYVMINGMPAVENGICSDADYGRVLSY